MKYIPESNKPAFTPWKENYRTANIIGGFGTALLGVGSVWCVMSPTLLPIAVTLLSVAPFYYWFKHREYGGRRKDGLAMEGRAVQKFQKYLPECWSCQTNVTMPGTRENIDLLVMLANGHRCVIDVKSWKAGLWVCDGALRKVAKSSAYQFKAQRLTAQLWRQIKSQRARHGIIWMPRAKHRPMFQYRGIKIIHGGVGYLIPALRALDVDLLEYTVAFPHPPDLHVRNALKRNQFRWDAEAKLWRAKLPSATAIEPLIMEAIKKAGGTINGDSGKKTETADIHHTIAEQFKMAGEELWYGGHHTNVLAAR